jgi:hypothetical protein
MMARKATAQADTPAEAPAKRTRRAATPAPAPAPAPEVTQDETAARRAAATAKLIEAEGWVKVIKTAVRAGDGEGARAAAEQLAVAAGGVRRAYSVRKTGGPVGPRTTGAGRYQLQDADGTRLRGSDYRASIARDRSQAKARIRDDVARDGDKALAESALVDTQAVTA